MSSKRKISFRSVVHEGFCRLYRASLSSTFHIPTFQYKATQTVLNIGDRFFALDIGQNIVLHEQKAIYFAVPKVANSSLKTFFANVIELDGESMRRGGKAHLFNHADSKEKLISSRILVTKSQAMQMENYWKFAFVRNPWDRLASFYNSALASSHVMNTLITAFGPLFSYGMQFDEFARSVCQIPDIVANRHFVSQHKYLVDTRGKLIPNFVGRFEKIDSDLDKVCQHMGIKVDDFGNVNQGMNRNSYQEMYTPTIRDMVSTRYRVDISLFEYTF